MVGWKSSLCENPAVKALKKKNKESKNDSTRTTCLLYFPSPVRPNLMSNISPVSRFHKVLM